MNAIAPINYTARAKAIRAKLWGVPPRVNWITHPPVEAMPPAQPEPVPETPAIRHDAHVDAWRRRNDVITAEMIATPFQRLMKEVATRHGLTPADLRGPCRKGPVSRARQELCYRAVEELGMTFPMIGQRLGGRDHTTIMDGYRRHGRRHDLPMTFQGRVG